MSTFPAGYDTVKSLYRLKTFDVCDLPYDPMAERKTDVLFSPAKSLHTKLTTPL